MAGLTKAAAAAQAKIEGFKLTTREGKTRVLELMAPLTRDYETIDLRKTRTSTEAPAHRFNWDSIPRDGLLTVIQRMAREGLNPREASDWDSSKFRAAYCNSSGTSEQKLDSLMKQFVS